MQYNFSNFKNELKKVSDHLAKEYSQLNIGRASPMVLDGITVESYGAFVPLNNVASVSIEDPKTLRIAPWDKSQIKDIERAVNAANIGLSLATDESGLRVIFPPLTTESRQTLVKLLKEKLEDARISLRREREEVLNDISKQEKEGKMNEDERFRAKEELQKIVDEGNAGLEAVFQKKEKEVMG